LPVLPLPPPPPPELVRPVIHTGYEVILASVLGAFIAQLIKFLRVWVFRGVVNFRLLVETGGMPSSHSASMTALATGVGLVSGWSSVDFAIAIGIAFVVMYDAAGVRRAAGRMAGILNQLTEDIYLHHPDRVPARLKELLGHTPIEVLGGGLLGCLISIVLHRWLGGA
jgi:uncharacterized protein